MKLNGNCGIKLTIHAFVFEKNDFENMLHTVILDTTTVVTNVHHFLTQYVEVPVIDQKKLFV